MSSFLSGWARHFALVALVLSAAPLVRVCAQEAPLHVNSLGYFEGGGVNVMVFQDIYPEGHQGGVGIIQNGVRVASNGDLRLEPTPGQWQPIPIQHGRTVDSLGNAITVRLAFPDSSRHRQGFNPIDYPDLYLPYTVRVEGEGPGVRVRVDLDRPLPDEWVGRVGFNLELFPGDLFGKNWYVDGEAGAFPRQPGGPVVRDARGEAQPVPLATGRRLVVAPETERQRMVIESRTGDLQLLDGRNKHNNGWFVVRSLVRAGVAKGAVEWYIEPTSDPAWRHGPVVQVSQVGYHPAQPKLAVVELDACDGAGGEARLLRVEEDGSLRTVKSGDAAKWGRFLRYDYRTFDFSDVREPGLYMVAFRDVRSHAFRIGADVYDRGVWQAVVEYFLPVQMCHMRVEEQYRVWHGACHLDDARMAPTDSTLFDGYIQGPSTMTRFAPGEHVPGLDRGGWHDAGDDDLRIESQADEVYLLASAYELFGVDYDNTTVDEAALVTRIHQPDGVPDLLQQIEHGVRTVLGSYEAMDRFYRGIIVPTLGQYVLLGDVTNSTNNVDYVAGSDSMQGVPDDRWVFTETNAGHEYKGVAALAIAGRVLRSTNPDLAERSVRAAEAMWSRERPEGEGFDEKVAAAVELLLTTGKDSYRDFLLNEQSRIAERIASTGWVVGKALPVIGDRAFSDAIRRAVAGYQAEVQAQGTETPYGIPYRPYIWGAGWGIQAFGVQQYFLHRAFPDLVDPAYLLSALNFILGVHPGANTASFASGVGARSMTIGYGLNRADWSYIPGGVVSGTALIRPDFPEMKEFPFLWQQVEYVMGGGSSHFLLLTLAADRLLSGEG